MTDTRHQVRRVLIITLILNLLVAAGKIAVGLMSGALAILADGFHSLMDGAGNVAALAANHIAARPPDDDHPYGHRRFETVGALIIGVLLLVTAWEIAQSALTRILRGGDPLIISPAVFAVLIITLIVNLAVSTYQRRAGVYLQSELLIADAANTRADVFVTASVLASSLLVWIGITWVDTAAALIVVTLIGRAAFDVLRQAGGVLVDTAPYAPHDLTTWVCAVPAVETVVRARSRGTHDAAHIDIDVQVAPAVTTAQNAAVARAIQAELRKQITQRGGQIAEVEVHFVPQPVPQTTIAQTARSHADALGVSIHEVAMQVNTWGPVLHLHVEVPAGQTLAAAHAQATALEHQLQREYPHIIDVVTHIEPAPVVSADTPLIPDSTPTNPKQLRQAVIDLLMAHYPNVGWHALHLYPHSEGCALSIHAALDPSMSIDAAHTLADAAEVLLLSHLPQLHTVTIHTEPVMQAS